LLRLITKATRNAADATAVRISTASRAPSNVDVPTTML
jgi:hypothetical protein